MTVPVPLGNLSMFEIFDATVSANAVTASKGLPMHDIFQIIILIILLCLSAFFSSAETALSTVNKVKIQSMAEEGNRRARLVDKILQSYSKMLSTILIGNNIVNIAASALTTLLATRLFGSVWVGVATGILTLFVLLFGEITPKTYAKLNNVKLSMRSAPVIRFLMVVLTPIVFVIDKISNGILRMMRINPNDKFTGITETEILNYVEVGHEEGVIESEEKEIIHNVFDFSDRVAKDIMIPRLNIVAADVDASYEELRTLFEENRYSRIPIYEENNDNIIGAVNIKDFAFVESRETFTIRSIMRDVYLTMEYKKVNELLTEMREKSEPLTIVLNEYGTAEGMITMEDLLEEIVGEIRDEYDEDEKKNLQEVGEREYIIEGSMKLDDINDELHIELASENYDSIGGIIIDSIDDRLPTQGEEVTLEDGTWLKVEELDHNRIAVVRMRLPEPVEEVSTGEDEETNENPANE